RFTTKNGTTAEIRYPLIGDVAALLEFINQHSLEDKFTRFSGEQQTLAEETEYLEGELAAVAAGDGVKLLCSVDNKIAGTVTIRRDKSLLARKLHTSTFGIVVAKEFRGQGIGKELTQHVMDQAIQHMSGLRMIKLECFSNNTVALSLYQKMGFREV